MARAPDFEAEGLLEGVEGTEERAARLELLRHLHESGVGLAQLRAAAAEDRLALLPVEVVLQGEPRYTTAEVAELARMDVERMERRRRALGLPVPDREARVWSEQDLDAARRTAEFFAGGFPEESSSAVERVLGAAMARVAEAMRAASAQALSRPGDTELDVGLRFAELARLAAPTWGPWLSYVLQQHLLEQVRGDVITRAEAAAGRLLPGAQDMGVAFADLVGFTRLGERRPVDELGAVADRLAEMAAAVARPPVRLVKTIGDAAMLVSPEPGPLLDGALALVAAADAESEDFPQLRAGVAFGPALNRGGGWYGHTVNVASRVTGMARPSSVLVTEAVHDELERDSYRWSFAGERKLKNVREPVKVFRARPPDAGDGRPGST